MHYLAFIHHENDQYGVSFPDVPGCVAVEDNLDAAIKAAGQALALHFEGEREADIPAARTAQEIMSDPGLAEEREGAFLVCVPFIRSSGTKRAFTLSLDTGLIKLADTVAKDRQTTRSGLVEIALREELAKG